jgi:hypothetical protein
MFKIEDHDEDHNDKAQELDRVNGSDLVPTSLSGLRIVCIPASDEADELVGMMLAQLLEHLGCDVHYLPVDSRDKLLSALVTYAPQVAIVSALPPFAVGQARSLCKWLRVQQLGLKIVVGLWNFDGGVAKAQDRVGPGVADMVATSLHQAISLLVASRDRSGNEIPPTDAVPQEIVTTEP